MFCPPVKNENVFGLFAGVRIIFVGQPRVVMPEAACPSSARDPPPAEKEVLGIILTSKIGTELFDKIEFFLEKT